jgi:hypothetical protein
VGNRLLGAVTCRSILRTRAAPALPLSWSTGSNRLQAESFLMLEACEIQNINNSLGRGDIGLGYVLSKKDPFASGTAPAPTRKHRLA